MADDISMSRVALAALVIVAVYLAIETPWDSGGGKKAELVQTVETAMRARGAPDELVDCLAGGMDRELSESEVEDVRDVFRVSNPPTSLEEITPSQFAAISKIGKIGIDCATSLAASGVFTPAQAVAFLTNP